MHVHVPEFAAKACDALARVRDIAGMRSMSENSAAIFGFAAGQRGLCWAVPSPIEHPAAYLRLRWPVQSFRSVNYESVSLPQCSKEWSCKAFPFRTQLPGEPATPIYTTQDTRPLLHTARITYTRPYASIKI